LKLHATINLYNDRQFLPACIESIAEYVDSVIVADGAYQLYYEEYKKFDKLAQPWSTDGSLEILHAVLANRAVPHSMFCGSHRENAGLTKPKNAQQS
jgi:hypothetical protein